MIAEREPSPRWPVDDEMLLHLGDLRIDRLRREASVGGRRLRLRRRQFDLLVALVMARGAVVPRSKLLLATSSAADHPQTRTIDVQVSQLRLALGADRLGIKAVRGVGYRLVVRATDERADPRATSPRKPDFTPPLHNPHQSLTRWPYR